MTTVGYGDVFPVTLIGRLIASVTFITGILLLAIPISVISGIFHSEYARVESLKQLRKDHAAQVGVDDHLPHRTAAILFSPAACARSTR